MSEPDADTTLVSLKLAELAATSEEYRKALAEVDEEAEALAEVLRTEEGRKRAISSIPGKRRAERPEGGGDGEQ